MTDLADIQARRAQRKADAEAARLKQLATDLAAVDALEQQHGDGRIVVDELEFYTPGLPTLVAMRVPNRSEFKRFQDMVNNPKQGATEAAELLGQSCQVYPEKDLYEKIREAHPGIHTVAATHAVMQSAGHREAEGKG